MDPPLRRWTLLRPPSGAYFGAVGGLLPEAQPARPKLDALFTLTVDSGGMATHAELAAQLLRECARFFRAVGPQQGDGEADMTAFAETCEVVAELVVKDPAAELTVDSFSESPQA